MLVYSLFCVIGLALQTTMSQLPLLILVSIHLYDNYGRLNVKKGIQENVTLQNIATEDVLR